MIFPNPTQLCLEILPADRDRAKQQSQSFSTPASRWRAYLNQLCLSAVLPWLQQEYDPQAQVWLGMAALPSFWEVVNGVAIALDNMRFLLIPSEAIDLDEMRVQQEWIDLPSWAADYYLAVQIEPDEGWVRIWGYATHQQLKIRGNYDRSDRTYSLDEEDLIADFNVFWVARQLCPGEPTRAAIASLPSLSLDCAENLLARLSERAVIEPRLAVPFSLWGSLLEHGGWRQRLYEKRLGRQEQWSVLDWLRGGVSGLAKQMAWERFELQTASKEGSTEEKAPAISTVLSRQLIVNHQPYELRALPLSDPEARIWRFELRSTSLAGSIPRGFKLRLLTEDLQPFENNEDIATEAVDRLYVEVAISPGEGLVWEVEPSPENCDREILRF
ncbi:DUF1822 family protein [Hydrococcus rivularis]|nr:DUF1822 family protein [Hydrococcus rivularis]